MLLILSARSFRKSIGAARKAMDLLDLPRVAHDELGLRGLLVTTDLLAGADTARIDRLRERADKAACPCLFLVETEAHPLAEPKSAPAAAATGRLERVLTAAQRLGCSAAAIAISGADSDAALELAAERLRPLAARADRLDLSLLIQPNPGLTATPERVTDLIKKVGGFRLGSLPDFQAAAASSDATGYLRRLSPYAPVVLASALGFSKEGEHEGYSLRVSADAITSVGFDGAVAIEYRGSGDVIEGVRRTRETLEPALFGAEAS